jgi:hypothetical protein
VRRLLAISLLAMAAAGCGGGGDRLTQEEFASQANAICQDFEQKIDDLGAPENLDDIEGFADEAAEIAGDGRDELAGLNPPEDLEADYARLLETLDEAIENIERIGDAAADGDEAEVQRIAEEGEAEDEDSDRLARELGLDDCAEDA